MKHSTTTTSASISASSHPEKLYTILEISKMLSLSTATISRNIKAGKLKSVKIGNQYRIKESDYMAFIAN